MDQNSKTPEFFHLKYVLAAITFATLVVFSVGKLIDIYIELAKYRALAPERTITISAEGSVEATPDLATAMFSVVSQGKSPEAVQEANIRKMNEVISFLTSQGIAEKDIASDYNLYPQYDYNQKSADGAYTIIGYQLTQTVTVKMRALDKVGAVLQGVVSRGVNQVGSITFSIDDPDQLKSEARAEALQKARVKAAELVTQGGVSLGKIVTITEGDSYVPPFYGIGGGEAAGRGGAAPDIQPGTQEVRVTVTVIFELL